MWGLHHSRGLHHGMRCVAWCLLHVVFVASRAHRRSTSAINAFCASCCALQGFGYPLVPSPPAYGSHVPNLFEVVVQVWLIRLACRMYSGYTRNSGASCALIAALHDKHASESVLIAYEHCSLVTVTALTVTALRPVLIAYKHVYSAHIQEQSSL